MLFILIDPSEKELAFVEMIRLHLEEGKETISPVQASKQDWLNPEQFEEMLTAKGYRAKLSKTRKSIAELYGLKYRKRGNQIWFENAIERIPARKRALPIK